MNYAQSLPYINLLYEQQSISSHLPRELLPNNNSSAPPQLIYSPCTWRYLNLTINTGGRKKENTKATQHVITQLLPEEELPICAQWRVLPSTAWIQQILTHRPFSLLFKLKLLLAESTLRSQQRIYSSISNHTIHTFR